MRGKKYPRMARWRRLTPLEQAERLDVAADLLESLQFWRGDPRLTAWEEGFMASIVQVIQTFDGKAKISRKQWDVIHAILDKMAREPPEAPEPDEYGELAETY